MSNFVLAVVGDKGGIGKTTIAYNMLFLLAKEGVSAVLIDCDNNQYSSANFAEDRREAKLRPELEVVNIPTKDLKKKLVSLSKKFEVIIVEFGKSNDDEKEGERESALELAMKISDQIIMPLQPSSSDARTISSIEDRLMKSEVKVPAFIIPNRVKNKQHLQLLLDVEEDLEYFSISKNYLKDRLCYQYSLGNEGRSIFEMKGIDAMKAQYEFKKLFNEVLNDD